MRDIWDTIKTGSGGGGSAPPPPPPSDDVEYNPFTNEAVDWIYRDDVVGKDIPIDIGDWSVIGSLGSTTLHKEYGSVCFDVEYTGEISTGANNVYSTGVKYGLPLMSDGDCFGVCFQYAYIPGKIPGKTQTVTSNNRVFVGLSPSAATHRSGLYLPYSPSNTSDTQTSPFLGYRNSANPGPGTIVGGNWSINPSNNFVVQPIFLKFKKVNNTKVDVFVHIYRGNNPMRATRLDAALSAANNFHLELTYHVYPKFTFNNPFKLLVHRYCFWSE